MGRTDRIKDRVKVLRPIEVELFIPHSRNFTHIDAVMTLHM